MAGASIIGERIRRLGTAPLLAPLLALGAGVTLTGCSGVALLNAVEPRGGIAVERDIAYRSGPRGGLDVLRQRADATARTGLSFVSKESAAWNVRRSVSKVINRVSKSTLEI